MRVADRSVRQFAALAVGKLLATLLAICAMVCAGWLLGPAGLGRWALIAAAGSLLHTALVNWTHPATVRYGREEWMVSGGLNRTVAARLPLVATGIAVAVLLLAFNPGQWTARWFMVAPADAWMVGLVALSLWLAAEAQATLQATDCIRRQAILAPIIGGLTVVGLLLLFALGRQSLGWTVAAFAVVPAVGWGAAWIHGLAESGARIGAPALTEVWRHARYGAPLLPTFVLGYLSDWGDHVLLTRFSTVAQVGFFAVSYQILAAMIAGNGLLTTVLLPRLIARHVAHPGAMRSYVQAEVPTLYGLWMIVAVWMTAMLPVAVALLAGAGFSESVRVLLVLLVAIPSSVVTSLYTILFNVQERTGRLLLYSSLLTFTNLAISLALIPTYGAVGAAAGTVCSYVVGQAFYVWDQHRQLAVPALGTWTLWMTGLAIGVAQLAAGPGAGWRIVWACAATAILVLVVRGMGSVDGRLVERLFAGRLTPLAVMINRTLVARLY